MPVSKRARRNRKRRRSQQHRTQSRRRLISSNHVRNYQQQQEQQDENAMTIEMTPEEIKELLEKNKADYDKLFKDFDQYPQKAVLLYYLNSGYLAFDQYKEFASDNASGHNEIDRSAIIDEIQEQALTDEERYKLLDRFFQEHPFANSWNGQLLQSLSKPIVNDTVWFIPVPNILQNCLVQ